MPDTILSKLTYGMYIVSSMNNGRFNGQLANSVFQITDSPATVAVCINRQNLTHEFISASGRLTVSILSEEAPMIFIGKFGFKSGRAIDKFKDTQFKLLESGCPAVIEYSVGYFEAVVKGRQEAGAHTLFTCEVVGSELFSAAVPMTYEYYHLVKKGLTPKAAPTFTQREV
jgi:ferric-chelate reductase [NAD(P)H]